MPNPTTTAAKPAGSIADRVERLLTPKSTDNKVDMEQQVRAQATLLQDLVTSLRTSEDMRVLTAQRNKQLAQENKRLKEKITLGSFDSVTKKEVESPAQMSTAEVSSLSVKPPSLATSGSTVTLSKEQMSELADSVAALKEVAFRREHTWERMARRQVALQKQINSQKDAAMLADQQLMNGAQIIKNQAAALKRDQTTIASLKKQINQINQIGNLNRVVKKSSLVEVMAPPARRPPHTATRGDDVAAILGGCRLSPMQEAAYVDSPGSRGGSKRDHHRYHHERRGYYMDKNGLYDGPTGPLSEKTGYYIKKNTHLTDRRERPMERRIVDHGSERKTLESLSPMKQRRGVGNDSRNTQGL